MTDQFVAEIRVFGTNFAPVGWAQCNGQILPISQNTALFSLIGTQFGGNGTSTFALPNLMGAAPLDPGQGPGLTAFNIGDSGGTTSTQLTTGQLPGHTHTVQAFAGRGGSTTASPQPGGSLSVGSGGEPYTATATGLAPMAPATVGAAGGTSAHNNVMPSLVVNFCIALQGIFPTRS